MLKALIVDDEWAPGQWLSLKLKEISTVESIHFLQNPHEVMPLIMQTAFDVVFLDIEMPELNGLELANQISCLDHPPEIIFVTSYNEYALNAFKVNALDYLVKPVRDEEFSRVIDKLKKSIAKHKQNENKIENEGMHTICVKMLANLKYYKLEREIDIDFPTAKCEELFIYMILKGNKSVSKWKLIEDIWIGKDAEKGEISIRTTVFRINKALSDAGIAVKIGAEKSNYRISDYIHIIDLEKLENIEIMSGDYQLVDIYPGMLLAEKNYFWCESLRSYYADLFCEKAWKSIEKNMDSIDNATDAFLLNLEYFISIFPWHEKAVLLAMSLILKKRGKVKLKSFYDQLSKIWLEEYDIEITDNIKKLFRLLMI